MDGKADTEATEENEQRPGPQEASGHLIKAVEQ